MPTVPKYDTPQVGLQGLPSARVNVNTAGAFGESLGHGLQQAGGVLASAYEDEKRKADRAATMSATNDLANAALSLEQSALAKQGEDALGVEQPTLADFDKLASTRRNALVNDDQRMVFDDQVARHRLMLRDSIGRHTAGQREKLYTAQEDVALSVAARSAVTGYTSEERIAAALIAQDDILTKRAERLGWTPEIKAEARAGLESKIHAAVLTQMMADENFGLAKKYFEANNDGIIDPEVRERLKKAVEDGSREAAALDTAGQIWGSMGPASDIDPVNMDRMMAEVDRRIEDPETRKSVLAELGYRAQIHNASAKEREDAYSSAVWTAVDEGSSLDAIRAMPEYKALTGEQKTQVSRYVRDQAYQEKTRAGKEDGEAFKKFWELNDPDTLANMSKESILAQYPTLGKVYVERLLTAKAALNDPAAYSATQTFKDRIDSALKISGLIPADRTPAKFSKREAELAASFESEAARTIAAFESANRRKATPEETQKVIDDLIKRRVFVDGGLFGRDEERLSYEVTPDEKGRAFVPLDRIPGDQVDGLRNLIRSRGKRVTEEKIERAFAAMQLNDRALFDQIISE